MLRRLTALLTGLFSLLAVEAEGQTSLEPAPAAGADTAWFEGRWAFAEEECNLPSNWTLIDGGNFVSEDVTGRWSWTGEKLILDLVDMALDEETGEAGERFRMEGSVMPVGEDQFTLMVEPDIYILNRCPD